MIAQGFSRFGLRFRSVAASDAEFLLQARRSPAAAPYLSYTDPSLDLQRKWVQSQNERAGDYYFIVEKADRSAIGTVGLYDIDQKAAEWGRFIVVDGSPAALSCALGIFDLAFCGLNLERVSSWTMVANEKTVRFHDRLGLPKKAVQRKVQMKDGEKDVAFVQHTITIDRWPSFYEHWSPIAQGTERLL